MADDGYLIGYEDSNNNFVEVGRFNNAAEDVNQPILIEHTASGERMELDGNGFDYQNADITNVGAFSSVSVSTAEALIDSLGPVLSESGDQMEVETGTISFQSAGASSDGWDDSVLNQETVTFAESFSSTPIVAFSRIHPEMLSKGILWVSGKSTTDFEWTFNQFSTNSTSERTHDWFAIGERA